MGKIQVYCAVSIDGFIAGQDDDLSWLDIGVAIGHDAWKWFGIRRKKAYYGSPKKGIGGDGA